VFLSAAERLRQKIVFIIETFLFENLFLSTLLSSEKLTSKSLYHIRWAVSLVFSGYTRLSQMALSITTLAKQFQKLESCIVMLCEVLLIVMLNIIMLSVVQFTPKGKFHPVYSLVVARNSWLILKVKFDFFNLAKCASKYFYISVNSKFALTFPQASGVVELSAML
jgi:hypothetical protein